jgi:hypothetical protein
MPDLARSDLDLVSRKASAALLWGLPLLAIIVTGVAPVGNMARTVTWTAALMAAGIACVVNARRSGRLHCHTTGPFFLVLAAASALHGLGAVPLGDTGWLLIGTVLVIGAPLLIFVPEWIWGRYGRQHGGCC